ncbi:MAG TPA: sensor histidine kinase N-terminal domain-containing protein [Casimicrobiaceae bacterium]|nr:sensor histidine kinase N-terminal domain-containing protein [Casimicrobiaceae bacterium]
MFTLFKYLVWLVVALTCLMLATISISEFLVNRAVNTPYDTRLSEYAQMLAAETRIDGGGVAIRPAAIGILRRIEHDRILFALRDAEGRVLVGDPTLPAVAGLRVHSPPTLQDAQIGDEPVRVAAMLLADPRSASRLLTVEVAETLEHRRALTETLRAQAVALPQMLVLVIAILLIVYGYAYVWRPMQRLRSLIDNRGSNDLSALDPESAPQDLRPLIMSINGLMQRLAVSIDKQRRFIADAAHQLRTPLAGLRSQAEIALAESDPVSLRRSLERLAAGTERATELANRMLALARADTPLAAPQVDVDLPALARDVISDHLPRANARGQDLGFEGPAPGRGAVVQGDRLLLRELLSNLVDNALRYTPDGGVITVNVESGPGTGATLSVTDSGPGIPAPEHDKVFEPFYRGSEAIAPGTGLGLTIVRSIAAAHGASVALRGGPNQRGLRVAVTFGTLAAA